MRDEMHDDPATPRPTDAELAILQVLWTHGPLTVRQVHEQLENPVGYTTVLKFLQIMSEKGLVTRDERDRAHIYAATEEASRTQGRLVRDLVDRAFAGATSRMVMQALAGRSTSRAELDEIRRFLDHIETSTPDEENPQ